MSWIFPILLLITFEAFADVFSKEYSLKHHWYLWLGALVGYIIANIFWLNAIRNGSGLSRGAIVFSVGSALVALVIGVIFYNEQVSTVEIVGMALGVVAITLIAFGGS